MKGSAYISSTVPGSIINEQALDQGWIQSVAVDAFVVGPTGAGPHEILRVLTGEKPFNILAPEIYR